MKSHPNDRRPLIFIFLLSAFIFFLSMGPAPLFAHKVTVFAWVENGTVHTESKFGGGRPVVKGKIEVFDPQGRRLLEGTTDDQGRLSFAAPQPSDLKIVLDAGMGHGGHWWVRAADFGAQDRHTAPVDNAPSSGTEQTADRVRPDSPECPDAEQIRLIVLQALETRLSPLESRLAEQRPPWRDVAGGIGYILGLTGLAVLLKNRRTRNGSEGS